MSQHSVVAKLAVLRAMARAGLIKLHPHTGRKVRHWSGQTVTAHYVDDTCPGVGRRFEFQGRQYQLKYLEGCFFPFIFDVSAAAENGLDLTANLMA